MPTPALLEVQRAFADALLEGDEGVARHVVEAGLSATERLAIYRDSCRAGLTEALRLTFPALERIVGAEFFDMAAARFIRAHPCQSGCLDEYGAGLAEFLARFEPASSLPYLPDVARFEWALGVAANAEDARFLETRALEKVPAERHEALRFVPHPSLSVLVLAYPADEIADAVLSGDEGAMAQVDLASGRVRLVVHRGRGGVQAQRLDPLACKLLMRLCTGAPLGRLAEMAPRESPGLLARALAEGWFTAFDA
jgi:hypothetical protein